MKNETKQEFIARNYSGRWAVVIGASAITLAYAFLGLLNLINWHGNEIFSYPFIAAAFFFAGYMSGKLAGWKSLLSLGIGVAGFFILFLRYAPHQSAFWGIALVIYLGFHLILLMGFLTGIAKRKADSMKLLAENTLKG